uniref:C-type lectin mannose binding isoform 5 variant 1 n=1 Tax=Oxyuranus microlepidotus TaxID=111177 RepID=I6LJ71_OXYMI|nr:C-type lectin mannose binding isoform 5 variant 1 [Oxyuranus microlepidotus]
MGRSLLVSLSLLVGTLSLNGIGADHHCPSDWTSLGEFCYKAIRERKSWEDAEAACVQRQNSSHLASIHSLAESLYIQTVISNRLSFFTDVWIGLNDPGKNRIWEWTDGSNFDYTSWELLEPGNAGRGAYCVQLSSISRHFRWEAANCESENFFVCKM